MRVCVCVCVCVFVHPKPVPWIAEAEELPGLHGALNNYRGRRVYEIVNHKIRIASHPAHLPTETDRMDEPLWPKSGAVHGPPDPLRSQSFQMKGLWGPRGPRVHGGFEVQFKRSETHGRRETRSLPKVILCHLGPNACVANVARAICATRFARITCVTACFM